MVEVQAAYLDFTVSLPLQYGTLSIDTSPVKGEVFVGGLSCGIAPVSMSVVVDSYVISFGDIAGYTKPSPVTVTVTANQEEKVLRTYIAVAQPSALPSWLIPALALGGVALLAFLLVGGNGTRVVSIDR